MKRLLFLTMACLLLPFTPIYAGTPAYAAEAGAGTEEQAPEDSMPRNVEDIKKELSLVASCLERLEERHVELTDVLAVFRTSNSMLLILIAMELMRLVRGWTKGGRHGDGLSG